jgi:hypothetical protein
MAVTGIWVPQPSMCTRTAGSRTESGVSARVPPARGGDPLIDAALDRLRVRAAVKLVADRLDDLSAEDRPSPFGAFARYELTPRVTISRFAFSPL